MRLFKQKVWQRRGVFKEKPSSGKKGRFRKLFLTFFICGIPILILLINFGFKNFLFGSGFFNITKVEVLDVFSDLEGIPKELKELESFGVYGQNIFKINLKELKFKIEKSHPEFKEISIIRILPNQLKINLKERKAVAQLRSGRYFPIDLEGILLPQIKNLPDEDLPVIWGFELNNTKTFDWDLSDEKRIVKALELIKEIEVNRYISNYKLKKIDISDSRNISFFLGSGMLEIKIGDSNFKERLTNLQTILSEFGTKSKEVRYIDLRFENPVISSK